MKLYVCNAWDTGRDFPVKEVLENPNVHGITYRVFSSNFLMGSSGYNGGFVSEVNNDFKLFHSYGKEIKLVVVFGDYFPHFDDCNYITLLDSNNNTGKKPIAITQPLFWEDNYLKRVEGLITYLSENLKMEYVTQVSMMGIQERYQELRCSDIDDYATNLTRPQAYESAALKWKSVGYNSISVCDAIIRLLDYQVEKFKRVITVPVLGTLGGFPCINGTTIVQPSERFDIAKWAIDYGVKNHPNFFAAESTSLQPTIGTPKKVSLSGAREIIYQFERANVGNPKIPATPQQIIDMNASVENGRVNNATHIEVHINNMKSYPQLKV